MIPHFAFAQNVQNPDEPQTLEEEITNDVLAEEIETVAETVLTGVPQDAENQYFTFAIENDLFASGEDQYYTNGFRVSYHNANTDLPEWARQMGSLYPGFDINETTSLTFSFGQNLYTPENIEISAPQPNDRPWAAWLYGSAALSSVTGDHADELELSLGMVGPAALGEEVQTIVHKAINAETPEGWDNQLDNEVGVMVAWSRRWPQYMGTSIGDDLWLSASPTVGLTLGNVYTYASAGANFRLSPTDEKLADLPLRVRPP